MTASQITARQNFLSTIKSKEWSDPNDFADLTSAKTAATAQ
jgi:hypothetical protein